MPEHEVGEPFSIVDALDTCRRRKAWDEAADAQPVLDRTGESAA
jgi:hypothetical protein